MSWWQTLVTFLTTPEGMATLAAILTAFLTVLHSLGYDVPVLTRVINAVVEWLNRPKGAVVEAGKPAPVTQPVLPSLLLAAGQELVRKRFAGETLSPEDNAALDSFWALTPKAK